MLSKFIIVLTTSWSTPQAKRHTFTMSERSWPSCLTTKVFVKGNKCKFHVSRISFLGYIKSKVTAVTNSPVPTTVKELQRFLWFSTGSSSADLASLPHPWHSCSRKDQETEVEHLKKSGIWMTQGGFHLSLILKHTDPFMLFICTHANQG